MIPDPYDPQNLNGYTYTRNNPLKYNDPTGNFLVVPLLVAGLGGAIIGGALGFGASVIVQQMETGQVNIDAATNAAIIGAVAGGVSGLTMGLGAPAIAGMTGSASLLAEGTLVAGSGVIGGQAALGASNMLEGRPALQGTMDPQYMATDAFVSLATFGLIKAVQCTAVHSSYTHEASLDRLNHAYKHANTLDLGFTGKSWGSERQQFTELTDNVIMNYDNLFYGRQGIYGATGYYKNVGGRNIVAYVFNEGPLKGKLSTVVRFGEEQMISHGLA
jgi:hypothetical protein